MHKSGYKPQMYAREDPNGIVIPLTEQAEEAAKFLEVHQWGKVQTDEHEQNET